ncbi:MAG TPA: hypothetical protein VLE93_03030 [Candidatus Saccharimonadales bacterium]|nr:hypothetical protein [Candidatus Saccharimonadales bacterium]
MFYTPFVTKVGGKPFVCYTDKDMVHYFSAGIREENARNKIVEFESNWLLMHQRTETQFVPEDTDFMIAFLWTDKTEIYVDVWLNRQLASYGECGPMKTLQTFRVSGGYIDPWEKGNGCDWTNIVTGREAEHRRAIMGAGGTLEKYIKGPRPEMPEGFIVPWPMHSRKLIKGGYGDLT